MSEVQKPPRLALTLLVGTVVVVLAGAAAFGSVRAHHVPLFSQIVSIGPRLSLVVENAHFCVPDTALVNCHTRVRRVLRIWIYAAGEQQMLLVHSWRQ